MAVLTLLQAGFQDLPKGVGRPSDMKVHLVSKYPKPDTCTYNRK